MVSAKGFFDTWIFSVGAMLFKIQHSHGLRCACECADVSGLGRID